MHAMRWLAVCAVGLMLTVSAAAQDKIELKANYEPGTYLMTQDISMDIDMSGEQKVQSTMQTLMVAEMEVAKADDKGARDVKMTFRRVKIDQNAGGAKVKYDSAAGEADQTSPIAKVFAAMIDKTISMTVDAKGKASNIKGVDEMVEAMVKNAGLPEESAEGMKKQFGDQMAEQVSQVQMFPDKPVGKGEKWEVSKKMDLPVIGQTEFTQTNTLKDVKDKVATIAFAGAVKNASSTTTGPAGRQVTVRNMNIKQQGTSQVDVETGLAKQVDLTQSGSFTVVAGEGDAKQETKFTLNSKGKITIEKGTYKAPQTKPAETPTDAKTE